MKRVTFLSLFLIFILQAQGQIFSFDELNNLTERPFEEITTYIAKNGEKYCLGDTLIFGNGSGVNGKFIHVALVDFMGNVTYPGVGIIGSKVRISDISVRGSKRVGFKVHIKAKGLTGLVPFMFFLEDAIEAGEIIGKGYSSDQALTELKKAKDKLDLGLITQEEYEVIKAKLSKYIK